LTAPLTLGLTGAELNTVTAGVLQVGNASAGAMTVSAAVAPGGTPTLDLETSSTITETGAATVTVANLAVRSAGSVTLTNANVTATVAGVVSNTGQGFTYRDANNLVIGTVDGVAGITTNGGAISVATVPGSLAVNQNVSAGAAPVTLTSGDAAGPGQDLTVAAGVTVSAVGNSVTLNAGDNLTISGTVQTSGVGIIALAGKVGNVDSIGTVITLAATGTLTAPAGATVTGSAFADTFNLRPLAGTPLTIAGLAPTSLPGDVLNLDLAGATTATLGLTVIGSGTFTFGNRSPAGYSSIETINATNGRFDLVQDMAAGGFQDGGTVPDDVVASGGAGNFLVTIADNGGAPVTAFNGALNGVNSFTLLGSTDPEILDIAETASGLPLLAGAAPATFNGIPTGAHSDAGALPAGTLPAGGPAIQFRGGGGADTLELNLATAHSVSVFSDTSGAGGNVAIDGLLASYTAVGSVLAIGGGGSLKVDASLIAATQFTLADFGTTSDGMSQVTGDGGQTPVTFDGFGALVVKGGTGSQTMTLAGVDGSAPAAPGVALSSVTLSGDNAAGTDTAANTLRVQSLPATVSATLLGAGGNDTFLIGSAANTLAPIVGLVTVDGRQGSNALAVNASGATTALVLGVTGNSITDNTRAFRLGYQATAGTFGGGISLTTGSGDDFIRVLGTLGNGTTSINTGAGADTIVVGSLLPATLANLIGNLNVDGGSGANALYVTEEGRTVPVQMTITATTIQSALSPATISYTATGGTFGRGILVLTGSGDDTVTVQGAPAGTLLSVFTGGGNDVVVVSPPAGSLSTLQSTLGIDGGTGINTLIVSEAGFDGSEALTVTGSAVVSTAQNFAILFGATGGTFGGGVRVQTGAGADTVQVRGTAANAPLSVFTGGGDDAIQVYAAASTGSTLQSTVGIDAGPGTNSLFVSEADYIGGDSLALLPGTVRSTGLGFAISYGATGGGTFGGGVMLAAGSGADTVNVFGGLANIPTRIATGVGADRVNVFVDTTSAYQLFIDSGATKGAPDGDSLLVMDVSGGATIVQEPLPGDDPRLTVLYPAGLTSIIDYQNFASVTTVPTFITPPPPSPSPGPSGPSGNGQLVSVIGM
jgi:hypothetical protein